MSASQMTKICSGSIPVGDVARVRGMMQLARDTGLSREGLYKALGENGNPSFATVMKVLGALGLKIHVEPQVAHS